MSILRASDGKDTVVLYIEATKERKILPQNMTVLAQNELLEVLCAKFGKENVKVTVQSLKDREIQFKIIANATGGITYGKTD